MEAELQQVAEKVGGFLEQLKAIQEGQGDKNLESALLCKTFMGEATAETDGVLKEKMEAMSKVVDDMVGLYSSNGGIPLKEDEEKLKTEMIMAGIDVAEETMVMVVRGLASAARDMVHPVKKRKLEN